MKKSVALALAILLVLISGCVNNPDFDKLNEQGWLNPQSPVIEPSQPPANTLPDAANPPAVDAYSGPVKFGDVVHADYNLFLEDGVREDSSEGRSPLVFRVGDGGLIKGFENGVLGMKTGESKTVQVSPEDGYGTVDPNKIQSLPPEVFSDIESLRVGDVVTSQQVGQGTIIEIGRGTDGNVSYVRVDFNHRLAGKTLRFEITVVKIESGA